MDTRSVLSCLPFQYDNKTNRFLELKEVSLLNDPFDQYLYYCTNKTTLNGNNYLMSWLTKQKILLDIKLNEIPLDSIKSWNVNEEEISHHENEFFKVRGFNIAIDNREVSQWDQPMIQPVRNGLIALLYTIKNDNLFFLVRAKI